MWKIRNVKILNWIVQKGYSCGFRGRWSRFRPQKPPQMYLGSSTPTIDLIFGNFQRMMTQYIETTYPGVFEIVDHHSKLKKHPGCVHGDRYTDQHWKPFWPRQGRKFLGRTLDCFRTSDNNFRRRQSWFLSLNALKIIFATLGQCASRERSVRFWAADARNCKLDRQNLYVPTLDFFWLRQGQNSF